MRPTASAMQVLGFSLAGAVLLSAQVQPVHGRTMPWSMALPAQPGLSIRSRLLQIRDIPPKPGLEGVSDPWYLGLVRDRALIAEGLLTCMGDATRIPCPYSQPSTSRFTLGDLAFSILCDLDLVSYDEVVAPFVGKAALEAQGNFALEDWLEKPGHRARLQRAARAWYRKHPSRPDGWWNAKP